MNRIRTLFAVILPLVFATALHAAPGRYDIIPAPKSLEQRQGEFTLTARTGISVDPLFAEVAEDFAVRVSASTGYRIKVNTAGSAGISFVRVDGLGDEEYRLTVSRDAVLIEASAPAGAFYGAQSLLQLFPASICSPTKVRGVKWKAACCYIEDAPQFEYRGLMLDCGRYFIPKETILKFIDVMSGYKQNIFHWHLTEDSGWRIEIKKYPRLTEVGSKRPFTADYHGENPDGKPVEGYYTQDDVREVVEYARRRMVTVIPEIELPGHSTAALAAYPELSCDTAKTYSVATSWGVKEDVYCPSAATFTFLEDVFRELFELFPSPVYHIGGDECPKTAWKNSSYCRNLMTVLGIDSYDDLQTFFVNRIGNFLSANGKTVMGWDEILDGGAVPGMIAESYRGHAPAARGIRRGNRVVLAPNRWCYLDYYQEDPETEHKSQSLFLPLEKVYSYYPCVDSLQELSEKYIIGVEGCIWGEYCENSDRAEYLAFPRAIALAEDGWTARESKDWDSFRSRLEKSFQRLDALGVGYSSAYWNVIFNYDSITRKRPDEADLRLSYPDAVIHYTLDGSAPTALSPVFTEVFTPLPGTLVRAQGFTPSGKPVGKAVQKQF